MARRAGEGSSRPRRATAASAIVLASSAIQRAIIEVDSDAAVIADAQSLGREPRLSLRRRATRPHAVASVLLPETSGTQSAGSLQHANRTAGPSRHSTTSTTAVPAPASATSRVEPQRRARDRRRRDTSPRASESRIFANDRKRVRSYRAGGRILARSAKPAQSRESLVETALGSTPSRSNHSP